MFAGGSLRLRLLCWRGNVTDLHQLRAELVEVAGGRCEWPYCKDAGQEMAHLHHRGMGGSPSANTLPNVALLCRRHHDLLDGRTALGTLRVELNQTLAAHLVYARRAFVID